MPKSVSTSTLEALRALQTAPPAPAPPRSTRAAFAALIIVGLFAAAAVAFSFVQDATLATLERQAASEVDALVAGSARFGAALRTFGLTRESEDQWFSRTSTLVTELHQRALQADATLAGIATTPRARVAENLQAAGETLERARANTEANRNLMARDVIESNGYPAADALDGSLRALRAATADEIGGSRATWRAAAALALAGWALVWGLGLLWLARLRHDAPPMPAALDTRPRPVAAEPPAPAVAAPVTAMSEPEPELSQPATPQPAMRDSGTVADACEVVARVTDARQLGPALEGIAQALGASGLVLWMRDGDVLAAAAAHGYPPGLPQRLGPVAAGDQNLIARAWQERASQTAPEAPGQRAAVASPIGATGLITGVLAAELPLGREADADLVATSRILAAQLSLVLGEAAVNGAAPHLEATGS